MRPGVDTKRLEQTRGRIGIALTFQDQRAGAAGDQHPGIGEAAREDGRLDRAVARRTGLVAAAARLMRPSKPATQKDDARDTFGHRVGTFGNRSSSGTREQRASDVQADSTKMSAACRLRQVQADANAAREAATDRMSSRRSD